jgi:hypothetical protein
MEFSHCRTGYITWIYTGYPTPSTHLSLEFPIYSPPVSAQYTIYSLRFVIGLIELFNCLIYYHCFPGICLIEWPDRLDSSVLSRARRIISVNMEIRDDQSRVIRVETK